MENNKHKTFTPTQAVINNSLRGKALFQKSKSVAHNNKANKISDITKSLEQESLNLEEVKNLYNFLNKAQDNYKPMQRSEEGLLDADSTAFLAAGGTSALAWSRLILKQEGILKTYRKEITEQELNSEEELVGIKLPVVKSVNEELMQATFIVMVPEEVDLHGDVTTEDEVRKACHNFNKYCQTANLFHLVQTESFEFAESYICPTDFVLGDKFVKKGSWLCTIQCLDQQLWGLIKSGEINGVSIGALASIETLDEE